MKNIEKQIEELIVAAKNEYDTCSERYRRTEIRERLVENIRNVIADVPWSMEYRYPNGYHSYTFAWYEKEANLVFIKTATFMDF